VTDGVVQFGRFGLPQSRKRHILVAVVESQFELDHVKPVASAPPALASYLRGLENEPETKSGAFYRPAQVTATNQERIDYLFDRDVHELPNEMRPYCHREKEHAYVSMYGRIHNDKPAQTLTSGFGSMGQGRYVHPTQRRLLTPHEAARIQGIPDFFDFSTVETVSSLREMIANVVPPQFMAAAVYQMIRRGVF
jgi:DNA (cytosine-5)-methyltransferase 1